MKKSKKSVNKIKAAFALLVAMLIIVVSYYNTLSDFKKVNEDINTVYNDRLVVALYIFQYANEFHSIKANSIEAKLGDPQKESAIFAALKSIQNIDKLYLKTLLTPNEKKCFDTFRASCLVTAKETRNKNWHQVTKTSDEALKTLEQLSQIQVAEGKSKLAHSNSLHKRNNMLGQLQVILLIILGCSCLYLLRPKKNKKVIKIPQSPSLN